MSDRPLPRILLAEALGTCLLLATVVGSGIMGARLSGGSVGLALLANALATGGILFVLISVLGPVSGAHFNPLVTVLAMTRREVAAASGIAMMLAQVAGGALGTILANLMFDLAPVTLSTTARGGAGQWLAEVVATAGLVLVISGSRGLAADRVAARIACYIVAAYWFTASTSFANPAVTLARTLSDTFAGIAPASVAGFVAAQVVGAMAGAGLGAALFGETAPPAN